MDLGTLEGDHVVSGIEGMRPRSNFKASDFEVGEQVVYTPQFGPREDGIVTSVGATVVFVRYKATQVRGTATYPRDLFKLRS